ncbi:hypothetical protein GCM10023205_82070 [Yinghuangia aomiensis]|uniref:Leucine-binding protein domain-containing protein n=1 Tax=Yinghuangia aomiensis TaxID=676205 RepID=A0ABP9IFH8_9ACTN
MRFRNLRLAAAVAALAFALAGCVATPPPGSQTATQKSQGAPPAPKIAPGVTDTEIKIGVLYPDAGAIAAFVQGGGGLGNYEAAYRAIIDRVNARGGINGRRIVPVFLSNNPVGAAPSQEGCVRLTEDEKVFAAVGFFVFDQPMCYLETHQTAVVGGPLTAKLYARARAPWFSTSHGGDEAAAAIEAFAARGLLAGRNVAVVSSALDLPTRDDTVLPALEKAGVHPVATAVMEPASFDTAAIDAQAGIVAEKLRSSGADIVIPVGSAVGVLTNAIAKTGWRPRMLFLDWSIGAFTAANADELGILNGAVVAGNNVNWDEATYRDCNETVTEAFATPSATGGSDGGSSAPAPTAVLGACGDLSLFTAIARKAGRTLDYASFQAAGFALGSFTVPGATAPTTYGPDKPAGTVIPPQLWSMDPASQGITPYIG